MNSAKKIMKNQGNEEAKKVRSAGGETMDRSKLVLLIIGLVVAAVLVSGVCYIQLRPRPILVVTANNEDGSTTKNTVVYKEAMYNIMTVEGQYNSMSSLYEQYYGSTFWEMENVDQKGRNGQQVAKKEVMDTLKQREVLCMEAEKNGVCLTAEDKKKADETVAEAVKNMTDEQKKMDGLSEDSIRQSVYRQALADKYKEQLIASLGINEEAIKAGVSKADYRQYTLQYYSIDKTSTDDEGNTKALDAATLAKNKKAIEDVYAAASKAKDFTKDIIKDEDKDNVDDSTGVNYATEDLLETDTDFMDKKTRKQVKKMANDSIAMYETDDAYYVIKMVNNNDTAAYDEQVETAISEEKESQFNNKYKTDIKPNYTLEVQSYWKSRVTLGGITLS